jgi:hypothetical protein
MAKCTAPVEGHRTASGAANCPACGGRSRYRVYGGYSGGGGYGGSSYGSSSYSRPSYSSGGGSSSTGRVRARWSGIGSGVYYSPAQVTTLEPIRANVERQASRVDLKDIFLCFAWDDRSGPAKQLNDLLVTRSIAVWFSPDSVQLGTDLLREIDKGLASSRMGVVLVTPAMIERLRRESKSIADRELSALLHRDQLVPVVHNTTFEALREVCPLLASRSGLDTSEETMADIAAKLAEVAKPPAVASH